jgi:hypothetical protein
MIIAAGILYAGIKSSASDSVEATLQRVPLPHMARIVLPGPGSMCRELQFDNDTGVFSNDRLRPCDDKQPSGMAAQNGSGLSSFRDAFSKRP